MGKKTEDMRNAIRRGQAASGGKKPVKLPPKLPPWQVAAAATAKKPNPRSAAARDARAKARGRLPVTTTFTTVYLGRGQHEGAMRVPYMGVAKEFIRRSDGLFRLIEELDIEFWNWFATLDADEKASMEFDTIDAKPEPMPKPATEEKT